MFLITGVCYIAFFSIHFVITGLKNIDHYSRVFILQGFIVWGFYCMFNSSHTGLLLLWCWSFCKVQCKVDTSAVSSKISLTIISEVWSVLVTQQHNDTVNANTHAKHLCNADVVMLLCYWSDYEQSLQERVNMTVWKSYLLCGLIELQIMCIKSPCLLWHVITFLSHQAIPEQKEGLLVIWLLPEWTRQHDDMGMHYQKGFGFQPV